MRAIRYHDEARLELVHEVGYYSAVNTLLGERFDKAIQSAAKRAAEFPDRFRIWDRPAFMERVECFPRSSISPSCI